MKKQYIRLAVVICVLILLLGVLGSGLITYVKAQRINETYMETCRINSREQVLSDFSDPYGYAMTVKKCISMNWRNAAELLPSDIGFYGSLSWDAGDAKISLGSSDFVRVWYLENGAITDQSYAIIVVDEPWDDISNTQQLQGVHTDAMCDGTLIYGGRFFYDSPSGNGRTERKLATPSTIDIKLEQPISRTYEGNTIISGWGMGEPLYAEYVKMAENASRSRLNEEASHICEAYLKASSQGEKFPETKKGFLTSYYIVSYKTDYNVTTVMGNVGVYIFHPCELAIRQNSGIYILFAVVILVLEGLVIFTMRRMYYNRRSYELRSRRLTRSIAHELKTPLAVTKAYVENWEYIDEEDRPEYAQKICDETDHMVKLVNSLLDLSKMDSGEQELKPEEVELDSLARSILRRMEPIIRERGLLVRFIPEEKSEDLCVTADLEMMKIVIGNFLSNAVKYSEKEVTVSVTGNSKNVKFLVRNDGQAISKKDQKRIWDLFYKADKARTDRFGSSGVGLAVNKSILEQHHAKYGCTSDQSGTEFYFEMKRTK